MKKNEVKYQSTTLAANSSGIQRELTPFELLKQNLRNNLKGLKKEDDKDSDSGSSTNLNQGAYKRVSPFGFNQIILIHTVLVFKD